MRKWLLLLLILCLPRSAKAQSAFAVQPLTGERVQVTGGTVFTGSANVTIPPTIFSLTDGATNSIFITAAGVLSIGTSGMGANFPIATVITANGVITSITDNRANGPTIGGGGSGSVSGQANNQIPLGTTATTITGTIPNPTTPNGVTFTLCDPVSGGASVPTTCWPGITVTSQTGATYTLAAADRSTCIEINNAALTLTIPDAGGTNFQFGYNFCILNVGSAATVNRTSASTFNELGALTAQAQTTFSLGAKQVAYFYTNASNNWDVAILAAGISGLTANQIPSAASATSLQNGSLTDEGNSTITSNPPNAALSNTDGWKVAWSSSSNGGVGPFAIGGSSQSTYLLQSNGGNGWFIISGSLPANNSGGGNPDTNAGTAFPNGGLTGGLYGKEGNCAGYTNNSGGMMLCPSSTAHEILVNTAGDSMASHTGMLVRRMPVPINSTGLTALVANGTTLCAASAGACNVAGQYHVHIDVWGSGTACGTPSPGGVTPNLSWTDENGVAHANVVIPMMSQTGAASTAVNVAAPTVAFQSALANEGGSGDFTLSTNGTVIQFGVAYAACGVGTGTYNIRISVNREQ